MKGYSFWTVDANPPTELFEGITNTGNQTFLFTSTGLGYNLMGNPYPSSVDWDEVSIPADLNGHFQLWDPTIGANGDYVYYTETGGPGNTTTQYIPSGQGFFTQATGSGTFTLDNSSRTHGTQTFYKNTTVTGEMLLLKVSGNDITTQTAIRFIEEATPQIDRLFDIQKIISGNPDIPNLYTHSENQKMAINTLPTINGHEVIPVSFDAGMDGHYSILAEELALIPEDVPVYLEDISLNYIQNLRLNPDYSFQYTSGNIREFKVHFKDITGIEEDNKEITGIKCYLSNETLIVDILSSEYFNDHTNISVYNMAGQLMLQTKTTKAHTEIPFHGNAAIYLVHIQHKDLSFSSKVFKQ